MLLKRVVLFAFTLCLVLTFGYLVWGGCVNAESTE